MRRGRPPYPDVLTPREQEVLALIREGLTNEQIGVRLGISEHGAKYHVAEILSKLGVSSRQEAARWSRSQRVAPGLVGLLTRHAALGALVVAGVGLIALAAGVLLMRERSSGATTGSSQAQRQEETLPPPPGVDDGPIRRIAYVEVQGEEGDIWTMNPDGSDKVQLTDEPGWEGDPVWSPSGRRIAFNMRPSGGDPRYELWVINSDGSDRRQILSDSGRAFVFWSPDGKKLAFTSSGNGPPNVFVVNLDGTNPTMLTNDTRVNSAEGWSKDGKSILFRNGAGLHLIDADGSNPRLVLPLNPDFGVNGAVRLDLSAAIVTREVDRVTGLADIELLSLLDNKATILARTVSSGSFELSPDGNELAYTTGLNTPEDEINVVSHDGSNVRSLYSEDLIGFLWITRWSEDGEYVIYFRIETFGRNPSESRLCMVPRAGGTPVCFEPIYRSFGDGDGPSSPSLLLN